jgi:hypothetical protein
MAKLSKQYSKNSRNTLYGHYLSYRLKHNVNFESYCALHEHNIKNYENAGRRWDWLR